MFLSNCECQLLPRGKPLAHLLSHAPEEVLDAAVEGVQAQGNPSDLQGLLRNGLAREPPVLSVRQFTQSLVSLYETFSAPGPWQTWA